MPSMWPSPEDVAEGSTQTEAGVSGKKNRKYTPRRLTYEVRLVDTQSPKLPLRKCVTWTIDCQHVIETENPANICIPNCYVMGVKPIR